MSKTKPATEKTKTPTQPEVRCKYDKLEDPKALKKHPDNPNHHPPEQLEVYGNVVEFAGFRRAVVVSKRSGLVIKGHGLVETAVLRGWPKVPVEIQNYRDHAAEVQDMLADNQLARLSDINLTKVAAVLDKMGKGADFGATAFDEATLEAIRKLAEIPAGNQGINEGDLNKKTHTCPACKFQW